MIDIFRQLSEPMLIYQAEEEEISDSPSKGWPCLLGENCAVFTRWQIHLVERLQKRFTGSRAYLWIWAPGYKTFLMLDPAEHEILNAHKYKNIKKIQLFFRLR